MAKDKKNKILTSITKFLKKHKKMPSFEDLKKLDITRDAVKHHFSSLSNIENVIRETHPEAFFDISVEDVLDRNTDKAINKELKKYKRFFITTAVTACEVHDGFYGAIKSYCEQNDAKLLLLIASDPAKSSNEYGSIDKKLSDETIVLSDVKLNDNIMISTIKLSAKHIDPTTGLDRIGQRAGSFIFASPKQRLQMVATSNIKMPHALMTTGAITKSNYNTNKYMSERTAYIADADHIMGGIIVELDENNLYHFRQVQTRAEDGSFVDIGIRYSNGSEPEEERPAALVLGDWHSGATDEAVRVQTFEMLDFLEPQSLVLHDAFDGASINHHEDGNLISKAVRANRNIDSLETEVNKLALDLLEFVNVRSLAKIYVVKSNHDEFLSKHYLQKAKYVFDAQNHYYSLSLAKAMIEGHDPLEFAVLNHVEYYSKEIPKVLGLFKDKVEFLQRDDDLKVADVQLGAHGDKGPNGSRGSLRSIEKAYGQSVTGHSHTPGILRGAWSVGTSSKLKLDYNVGPSSWLNTHCVVYSDGTRQLINIINGKWKLD